MMIVSDQLIEQLTAASDKLKRAWAEYDLRIAEAGASHFDDTAAAIRRELKLDLLLSELNRCLARIGHVDPRTDHGRRLERDEPTRLN
jgi:hypothetical protein